MSSFCLLTLTLLALNPQQITVLIFSLLVPVVIICTIIYRKRVKALLLKEEKNFEATTKPLLELTKLSIDNVDKLDEIIKETGTDRLQKSWQNAKSESQSRYGGRWFPALEDYFNPRNLMLPEELSILSRRPANLVLSIGILTTVLLYLYIKYLTTLNFVGLALLPLAVGLVCYLVLRVERQEAQEKLSALYHRLNHALAAVIPVYTDHSATALLIERMVEQEDALSKSVEELTESTREMANKEFSAGICQAVREIMSEEVVPPINEATQLLGDLALDLNKRQVTGMEKLAAEFSEQLTKKIDSRMAPFQDELTKLNRLIGRTRDFIADSVEILNISRQQNIVLNKEIRTSLQLMNKAKSDLAGEMAAISENVKQLNLSNEQMTRLYAGEEDDLGKKINQLANTMAEGIKFAGSSLEESSNALAEARQLRTDQNQQYAECSQQLKQVIDHLQTVEKSMQLASQNFSQESSQYVQDSLTAFDRGLAEVVERLVFTASALRDAVDTLPDALKQNPGRKI